MPFFQGASDIVIYGGEFHDVTGSFVIKDTRERVSNYKSHNTDDLVENDSNNTSSVRRGGPARELHLPSKILELPFYQSNCSPCYITGATRRPPSRTDSLPPYDNPNNFPTSTHTPVDVAASIPTSIPTQHERLAEVDSRRAPSPANTMASDDCDNDNDRMKE